MGLEALDVQTENGVGGFSDVQVLQHTFRMRCLDHGLFHVVDLTFSSSNIFLIPKYPSFGKAEVKLAAGMTDLVGN
jgi:hypothetical protein